MKKVNRSATTKKRASKKKSVIEHPLSSPQKFNNREIGWLNFNKRVLHESEDERTPLLERVRFLSICQSNLDEFFMKRVGGLKRQVAYGITAKSSDGATPEQQLASIKKLAQEMMNDQDHCFEKHIKPALEKNKIYLKSWADLTVAEKEIAKNYYTKNVFPILTPLSVDPGHPFPFISNLSTSLAVVLKQSDKEERFFARVKIPKVLPQWIKVTTAPDQYKFVSLLEVIKEHVGDLFPSMAVVGVMPFRITRNADITRDEEDAEDLLELIEEEIKQRRFAEVVRLEHPVVADDWILRFLIDELQLNDDDLFEVHGEFDYTDLVMITDLPLPHLKYEAWIPRVPLAFADESVSIFNVIKQKDQLVHHPYDSFSATVEKFIIQAADDPKVLAIKMTLYRTGDNSQFIKALIRAAEDGKQVVCLVELKARFDEERNIYWAQALENAGVHVVYGVVGLKTHTKTVLVVRQDADAIRSYVHIGTGNYNAATSKFYTDVGLFTCNELITSEIVELFHYLTGRSLKSDYKNLLIAPVNLFSRIKQMIERETDHAKNKRPSQIIAKFNSMEENDISIALYNASQMGTNIDLIVRGFCCLKPGVPGLSERIKVYSIIGRFLEHSRIFYFRNGKEDPIDGDFYIGSADWMYRNFHARVEAVCPIYDRSVKEKLWEILTAYTKDQRQTWDMSPDGNYKQRKSNDPNQIGVQAQLLKAAAAKTTQIEEPAQNHEDEDEI